MEPLKARMTVVGPDGTETQQEVTSTVEVDKQDPTRVILTMPNGFGIIHDSKGYTETHTIKAVAYDAAGNRSETTPIRIFVVHEDDKGPKPRGQGGNLLDLDDPTRLAALPLRRE
jgi:hypothetical protein